MSDTSVVILTGGKSSRFGSDKTSALLHTKTVVQHLLESLPHSWPIIVAGPEFTAERASLRFTREDPIGGGPVAALSAALAFVETEFVAVVAGDMPFAGRAIRALSEHGITHDGLIAIDDEGFAQTLCAIYRTQPLKEVVTSLGTQGGRSMRSLVDLLQIEEVTLGKEFTSSLIDVDTPEDLKRAQNEVKNMDEWITAVRKELGVSVDIDVDSILDVARDAAHAVERKTAPITTFLLGYAVAQGADLKGSVEKIALLAKQWPASE